MEQSIPAKTRAYRNYGTDDAALELFHYDASMDGTQDQFSAEVRQYGTRAIENFIGRHKDILLAKGQLHLLRQIEKSFKNPRADISSLATQTYNVLDDYLQVHRDSRAAQETGVHPYAKAVRRDEQGPDHKKVGDMAAALHKRFPYDTETELINSISTLQTEAKQLRFGEGEKQARDLVLHRYLGRLHELAQ